jgi:hypothetical protein
MRLAIGRASVRNHFASVSGGLPVEAETPPKNDRRTLNDAKNVCPRDRQRRLLTPATGDAASVRCTSA